MYLAENLVPDSFDKSANGRICCRKKCQVDRKRRRCVVSHLRSSSHPAYSPLDDHDSSILCLLISGCRHPQGPPALTSWRPDVLVATRRAGATCSVGFLWTHAEKERQKNKNQCAAPESAASISFRWLSRSIICLQGDITASRQPLIGGEEDEARTLLLSEPWRRPRHTWRSRWTRVWGWRRGPTASRRDPRPRRASTATPCWRRTPTS